MPKPAKTRKCTFCSLTVKVLDSEWDTRYKCFSYHVESHDCPQGKEAQAVNFTLQGKLSGK